MNSAFYLAIDRLPLGTVAAIEFVPVIGLAAFGVRSFRNLAALALSVGVSLLTHVRLSGGLIGFVLAFANAGLFACYIVLGHRVARRAASSGIDGLAAAMLIALVVQSPIGGWAAVPALLHPSLLLAGIGVGICSSVIPYVTDQLAMARLARSTHALLIALLPAVATLVGWSCSARSHDRSRPRGCAGRRWDRPSPRAARGPRSRIGRRVTRWTTCDSAPRG